MKKRTLRYFHEDEGFKKNWMRLATRLGQIMNSENPMDRITAAEKMKRLLPRVYVADSYETMDELKKIIDKLAELEFYRTRKLYLHWRFVPFLERAMK